MKKNRFGVLNENLLNKIVVSNQEISGNVNFDLKCSKEMLNGLNKVALKHSSDMEIDGYFLTNGEIKKRKRETFKSIRETYQWAINVYRGTLSEWWIKGIAYYLEPQIYKMMFDDKPSYRKKPIQIRGARWSPPGPEKIEKLMKEFLEENKTLDNIVEKALHAHFKIVEIHPFEDGNGRTARLVQNVMLRYEGYPPITILKKEKPIYDKIIEDAVDSLKITRKPMTHQLYEFYDYLRKKLSKEIKNIKETCKTNGG